MSLELLNAIKIDANKFRIPATATRDDAFHPPGLIKLLPADADLLSYYNMDVDNELCVGSMGDVDEHIWQMASDLLRKIFGREEGKALQYSIMDATDLYHADIKLPESCNPEFIFNYLSHSALAISTCVNAKSYVNEADVSTVANRSWALIQLKYKAFCAGLIPVGSEGSRGSARLLAWKPWVEV